MLGDQRFGNAFDDAFHKIDKEPEMKGNAQLMPMISVESVDRERAFYVEKLGFGHMMGMLGKDGQLDFCTVTLAGARVMLQRPQQRVEGTSATTSRRAVELYIEVDNVNEYHDQVKKRGVQISDPLTDQMMNILPAGFSTFCLKK